ncbi:MAG: dNTP triphosphohydrolase [Methanosarcinales archaeon]|nr:dNTP triphosphohydrolase [Methanosarcinales archaeon]
MNPCSKLKQKFDKADRLEQDVEKSVSIRHKFQEGMDRNGFARDKDRILFTRAFRRLQHKTQMFPYEKGDHFRTRLTHTMEVSQISRSLARYLSVDEDLAEAIALGHDIGHTPFGHQGEEVLDGIMSGEDNLGKDIEIQLNHGGFKHNYNSIKILDVTQLKYEDISGLNLSWQVLEGILKHTTINRHPKDECEECGKCWDIERFVNNKELIERLYLNHDFSVTLEGQIVAIADEIAQRQHDIDDGLRGLPSSIRISKLYEEIIGKSQKIIEETKLSLNEKIGFEKEHLHDCIELLNELVSTLEQNKKSKNRTFKKVSLIRNIIEFFILDVFATTKYNYNKNMLYMLQDNKKILNVEIVCFSDVAEKLDDFIESYIKKQIINSYEINKSNGKSKYLIRQLFKAYYKNPLQMPHYTMELLEKKIKHNSEFFSIKIKSNVSSERRLEDIKFKDGDRTEIDSFISILKLEKLNENMVDQESFLSHLSEFEKINNNDSEKLTSEQEKFLKCLLENNYAFLSTICDYIAGMTDNYAKKEFKDLY